MPKLKLEAVVDEKPVKVTIELPASLHRDLSAYAAILSRQQGEEVHDPARLIVPMLSRFIATDREFARQRRGAASAGQSKGDDVHS